MQKFKVEITDTFGGEANYGWVRRYEISAKSVHGVLCKIAKIYGPGWTLDYFTGENWRYSHKTDTVCMFIAWS